MMHVRIDGYCDDHYEAFRRLNLEWLEKYHLTEDHDLKILNDPRTTILKSGGVLFVAIEGNRVVGTAGLMKDDADGVYELVKMAVDPQYHGKGIGKMLLDRCISTAENLGARKIVLWSNSQLKAAIHIYEKSGFVHVPVVNSPLLTADVRMELAMDKRLL